VGSYICRRHFAGKVEALQVTGKAPHSLQSLTPLDRVVDWRPGPGQRQLGGDRRRTFLLEMIDEFGEQVACVLELEAQRPTDRQIVIERFTQPGHTSPPGHG
jgi:hypothetical protein